MDAATRPPVSLPAELWMPVKDYEGTYLISDLGQPHSLDRTVRRSDGRPTRVKGQPLSTRSHATNGGYPMVTLSLAGVSRQHYIHRLVLEAFRGPCPPGMEARHLNGDAKDARLVNLEWSTHIENIADQKIHGTQSRLNVTHCPYDHRLELPNLVPSRLPYRTCLACSRTRPEVARLRRLGFSPSHQEISDSRYVAIMTGTTLRRRASSSECRFGHPLVPLNLVVAPAADCLACSRTYGPAARALARGESVDFQALSDQRFAELAGLVRAT